MGKRKSSKTLPKKSVGPRQAGPIARSADEKKVWAVLERAQQEVKPIVKREREGELVSEEILNLRIRG